MTAARAILRNQISLNVPGQKKPSPTNSIGRNHPWAGHVRPRPGTYLTGQGPSVSLLIGPHLPQIAPPAARSTVAARKVVARIASLFVMNPTIT